MQFTSDTAWGIVSIGEDEIASPTMAPTKAPAKTSSRSRPRLRLAEIDDLEPPAEERQEFILADVARLKSDLIREYVRD